MWSGYLQSTANSFGQTLSQTLNTLGIKTVRIGGRFALALQQNSTDEAKSQLEHFTTEESSAR